MYTCMFKLSYSLIKKNISSEMIELVIIKKLSILFNNKNFQSNFYFILAIFCMHFMLCLAKPMIDVGVCIILYDLFLKFSLK